MTSERQEFEILVSRLTLLSLANNIRATNPALCITMEEHLAAWRDHKTYDVDASFVLDIAKDIVRTALEIVPRPPRRGQRRRIFSTAHELQELIDATEAASRLTREFDPNIHKMSCLARYRRSDSECDCGATRGR